MVERGSPPPVSRGRSFDDRMLTGSSDHQQQKQRSSDASASEDEFGGGGRPKVMRRKTNDESMPRTRPVLPTRKPVVRSMSGDPSGDARRAMMNKRAMSTRDFGGRGGRGLAMARSGRGPGGGRGGMMAAQQRSMSTRLLGAASDFTRMASTRALFMDEPEEEPSIIMYMGREIKVEDHFDEEWIEDALDEEAGLKNQSSRMSMSNNSSRRSQNSADRDGSGRDHDQHSDDEEGSEVEEDMEEMEEDTSANDGPKRRGRQGSRRSSTTNKGRSQSVEAPAVRPSRPPPSKRGVFRSRTFDGRQTSEILPRRRKPKNRSVKQQGVRPKVDLTKQYKEFLARTGGITPTGNQPYQNYEQFIIIPRRQPKMPTSRKKVEQFRKLEYTAEDIQDVLCEDDDTFQRLKRVLTKKGAITNGVLQQRLHIFLKKAKDRQSKLAQQRKEEGKEQTDNTTNLQPTQPDWAAMSMMDMFAHSVRKLTSDTTATTPSPTAAAGGAAGSGGGGGGDEEPKFQRRALPRMQAVMAKRNKMQANKASRTLMTTFAEEDEEGEESSNYENSRRNMEKEEQQPRRSLSPFRGSRATSPAPSPIRRPKSSSISSGGGGGGGSFIAMRDSAGDNALHKGLIDDDVMIQPKELPVTSSKPMELDLSQPRELPVANNKPMELDLSSHFKSTPQRAKEAAAMEPKCLDDELSASQRPMELDLRQSFQDLPVQPKCLDDELSASQRPMELDLKQSFGDLQPKCLDDSKQDEKPMTLDLSGSGNQPLLFTPKNMDEGNNADADLLFQPKNLDDNNNNNTMIDGSRNRRRHRPSKIRRNMSSGSRGSTRSSISDGSATPTKNRARRTKSMQDEPPPLDIKCLDGQAPSRTESSGSRNSASKPAPPGLLVGWQH